MPKIADFKLRIFYGSGSEDSNIICFMFAFDGTKLYFATRILCEDHSSLSSLSLSQFSSCNKLSEIVIILLIFLLNQKWFQTSERSLRFYYKNNAFILFFWFLKWFNYNFINVFFLLSNIRWTCYIRAIVYVLWFVFVYLFFSPFLQLCCMSWYSAFE
jgi:hypothetical protein